MANLAIGIEGLVGAGKTSICRRLIQIMPNTVLFNGGNLYRAIVYGLMKNGNSLEELKSAGKSLDIKEMMDFLKIEIKFEDGESIIYIDGQKVDEDTIQSKEASLAVSTVGGSADNRSLFIFARELIDKIKEEHNVIISGRSVMKIYPDADYHLFITADLDTRVKRKCIQYKNQEEFEEVKKNIQKRDELQEKAGFYELSPITITVDVTDCESVEESTKRVLSKIKVPNLT